MFHFYLIFCGDVLLIYLVTLVVYMLVDVVSALIDTVKYVIISMINRTVVVFTDTIRAAVISSACIVPYDSDKFSLRFPAISRSSPHVRLLIAATTYSMAEAFLGAHKIPPLPLCHQMVRILYNPKPIVRTASCLSPVPSP